MRATPATSLSRLARLAVTTLVILPVAACSEAPSAPQFDAPKPKKDAICVQTDANGTITVTQQPDSYGGCAAGFDLHIWN